MVRRTSLRFTGWSPFTPKPSPGPALGFVKYSARPEHAQRCYVGGRHSGESAYTVGRHGGFRMPARLPTFANVRTAVPVVSQLAYRTPIVTSRTLSDMLGVSITFKAENLQRTGSFKVRGATYKLTKLSASERRRGVVAASAGNHAQGVAL